jgi:glucosamine-6-phosphate deaminase
MELIIRPDREAAAELVARIVAHEVRSHPRAVLGLATGSTMEAVYHHLVRLQRESKLDFSGVRTFNLDEYVGLDPASPHSYRHFMN